MEEKVDASVMRAALRVAAVAMRVWVGRGVSCTVRVPFSLFGLWCLAGLRGWEAAKGVW